MFYMYRLIPEILRFHPIPPFIFPLQSLLVILICFLFIAIFHTYAKMQIKRIGRMDGWIKDG